MSRVSILVLAMLAALWWAVGNLRRALPPDLVVIQAGPVGGSFDTHARRYAAYLEQLGLRAQVRNQYVGFIFQNFQLLPTLTALENVMVPLELRGEKNIKARSMDLLDKVGLADRGHHYPAQLSGGEQQRVSLARAFSNSPAILFADEPTGNLDAETSEKVVKLIFDLNKEAGTTLVLVTHDLELAGKTQRIIRIKGGKLIADDKTENK